MFDQELDIKIETFHHNGWQTIFHRDVSFPLKTANVIPFRNALKKELEKFLDGKCLNRHQTLNYMKERGTVLKFTYYHKGVNGYRDSITQHIKMTEEGWRCGIISFAEKIWRN